ncbi:MAG: hypothetical protein LC098_04225 [Burkholderiales bacterium]|nr:hypothetical protein [Burkholderiales bacterium]
MYLWLWYVPGTDDQIREACAAAATVLEQRGVTIEQAFNAAVAANEVEEAQAREDMPTANAAAVAAWYAAEYVALETLAEITGEWPLQGALITRESTGSATT